MLHASARLVQLPVLRKLRDLVRVGAVVTGQRPERSPRLLDDPVAFGAIVAELWGNAKGAHAAGAGKVYVDTLLAEVLAAERIVPDFEHTRPQPDTALLFVHRTLPDGEIYWVNNRRQRPESVEATFRVSGKAPELWHPETGQIEPVAYRIEGTRTVVPLRLDGDDAVFVVFRKAASVPVRAIPAPTIVTLATIEGPWSVTFQPGRGAPSSATFPSLASWTENLDTGIKYFSGTATYTKRLDAPAEWLAKGTEVWLDLGDVKNLAEVTVNGQRCQVLWRPPFRVNITAALKPAANDVQIAVTNLWVNRVIGDQQPGVGQPFTYTPMPFYRANSPLLPSGLLGPVQVLKVGAL